ncbi:acetylserotonin methytransferase-like protein [Diplocarpon rosae]|nr:acetylserotonin methytransferase-like protein [Diplocarpon rosae]
MPEKSLNKGLKLFPPPPKEKTDRNPSRTPSTRRHAVGSQSPPESAVERSESPTFAVDAQPSAMDGQPSALGGRSTTRNGNGRQTPQLDQAFPITTPPPAHFGSDIPRSHTSFSEAPTLVRSHSNSSSSSNAKAANRSPQRGEPAIMRSMFPRYNHQIALEHQAYYPTQTSPTHIPSFSINRKPYSPGLSDERSTAGLQSPMPAGLPGQVPGQCPRGIQDEKILEPSSNDELKEFWKLVNGWRVSSSEGRRFCLRMTSDPEEPTHTLSSATQPFYTLRLVPTSTSAQMTMLRHDPNKTAQGTGSPKIGSAKPHPGSEVMSATLEETARRLPPNDGLVALLYPRAASDMVIELANKSTRADSEQVIAAAERECGRLVWDEDSGKYYLVHPAIPTPFVVSIHSSPAWSRVEYTLEHFELPHNIARLVRDGSGFGSLEVDTAAAARIDSFYIVDVAICAIMLVAITEEKTSNSARFQAPPSIAPVFPGSPGRQSLSWPINSKGKGKDKSEKTSMKIDKMEEFEVDLESRTSVKMKKAKQKDQRVPGCLGLIWMLLKCLVWTITMSVKALAKVIIFISRVLTRTEKPPA